MTSNDKSELHPIVLFRCPATLALPTGDPHALAVECMLRFAGADFVQRDASMPVALEIPIEDIDVTSSRGAAVKRQEGVTSCIQVVDTLLHINESHLQETQRALLPCVHALAEKMLLPAFVYIIHRDEALFNNAILKSVVPKVCKIWRRLLGMYRGDILKQHSLCGRYNSTQEALQDIEKGLRALNALLIVNATDICSFILGSENPSTADALAYAAASSFLHADFASHHASSVVLQLQHRLNEELTALVKYTERLRTLYFEEYSGFYKIRATSESFPTTNAEANHMGVSFQRGRWMTIACTIGFSLFYFLLTNAEVILTALAEVDMDEMEEGDRGETDS